MESRALLRAFRHWPVALMTFLLVGTVTVVAAFLPQERHEASAVVSVQPAPTGAASPQVVEFMIPSVEARVVGPALAAKVKAALPADLREAAWVVDTAVAPGSGVVRITVNSEDSRVPVPAANAYAQTIATENLGTDRLQVLVLDQATQARATSPVLTILVAGFGLAFILAFLAALTREAVTGESSARASLGQPAPRQRLLPPMPATEPAPRAMETVPQHSRS